MTKLDEAVEQVTMYEVSGTYAIERALETMGRKGDQFTASVLVEMSKNYWERLGNDGEETAESEFWKDEIKKVLEK